jgi:hypothetical protein
MLNMRRIGLLLFICLAALVGIASAGCVAQTNSIITHSPLGMLIPLGIENWVPATTAIMYYGYISIFILVVLATFSGMSNESRFLVMVPYTAAGLVFVGWLQAPNAAGYWGSIIGCCLFGTLLYINDMNREKYGTSGPGTKVLSVAIMIIVFEAAVVMMANPTFSPFPDTTISGQSQSSLTCSGYGYSCDSNGQIDLSASVSTVTSSGGANLDIISIGIWLAGMGVAMIKFLILILAAVFLFSGVLLATYPVLAASPQAIIVLGIMQLAIWVIYMVAWVNWTMKPSYETLQV